MRTLVGLAFLVTGCQLLPQTEVSCDNYDRCAPSQSMMPPPEMVQAPFVLGQPDDKTNWLIRGLYSPQGVAIVGNKLLVADTNNQRVLVWNDFPTSNYQAADYVLGQQQLSTQVTLYYLQNATLDPVRVASDGTRLAVVSDGPTSNRLIFWNSFPNASYARNDYFMDPGVGPGVAGPRIFNGTSPLFAGGHLYVSDRGFSRVLMWDAPPASSTDATRAIGQANLTSGGANPGGVMAGTFSGPEGSPASDGTRLFVPDTKNHRVLMWDALPTANTPADRVLGQASATVNAANRGATPGLDTMNNPGGVSAFGTHLAVVDRSNHRVLLWNQIPTTMGQTADLVLGQMTGAGSGPNANGLTASALNNPHGVATDGTHLAVADTDNNRVLLWNSWPTSNAAPADLVLGQSVMNKSQANARVPSVSRYQYPAGITRAGNKLVVVDRDVHRVLIWPRLPTVASEEPTIVLGQSDFGARSSNAGGGPSAVGLDNPHAASSDGNILAVADSDNNRVLIWSTIPTRTQQPADLVLGQPSLTSDVYNTGGAPLGLDTPYGVFVRDGRIYVADSDNDRVLIWKTIPTQNHQHADIVLGQADFNGTNSNHGGPVSNNGLSRPMAVFADDSHIYVSDSNNARVLIWNTLDPTNGQAADSVLGQADFGSGGHALTPNAQTIGTPLGMDFFNNIFYVCDTENNRIATFSGRPSSMNQPVNALIGQVSYTSNAANAGGLSTSSVQAPSAILATDVGIYIADAGNSRVLVLPPVK